MSLIHCRKIYSPIEGEADRLMALKLPFRELRKIDGITVCEGFVVEAEKTLDPNKKSIELLCLHCGKRFYYETRMYMRILKALGVDFSKRLP